jgi:tetratricopeptide (TPR) repeat protein
VTLKVPLEKTLKAKRQAMEKALAAYQAAADYGIVEVTTAATFATAELYRRLATDLMQSERPAQLGADELEQYDLLLEEQAYPFEERAIELHEVNVARAREGLFDRPVQASFRALADMKPARYARRELPAASADAKGQLGDAVAAAASGDWGAAEESFTKALEAAAAPAAPFTNVAASHAGGTPAATPVLPPAPEPGATAAALTGLGLTYRNTGRFALAEQAYRSALVADPAYPPALLDLGVLLDLYLQQPDAALEQYRAYQAAVGQPDSRVDAWISEVEIRAGREAAVRR